MFLTLTNAYVVSISTIGIWILECFEVLMKCSKMDYCFMDYVAFFVRLLKDLQ